MSSPKTTWSDCRTCCRITHHEILYQHVEETEPENYHEKDTWQVVRCLGCHAIGFRHRNDDYENVREDEDGNVAHSIEISLYPSVIKNHRKLTNSYFIPALIRKIYYQTLKALSEKALVLASIGLRATIEATCNHLDLSGSSLERRIDQLFKGGYVSNGDKKRLHAIRFLGNDAAHEIKEPKDSEILIALEIVEHMLSSVFILPRRAKSLETQIDNYSDFVPLIHSCTKVYSGDKAISLSGLMGRQRRQVGQLLDDFETKLKADITA